jgi:hypothetical protein
MSLPGTLGTVWGDWESTTRCSCTTCPACGVMHTSEADIILWGECAACPRPTAGKLAQSQLNTSGCGFDDNLLRQPLTCSGTRNPHRAVGLSRVWVAFRPPYSGMIHFDLKARCHNCGADGSHFKPVLKPGSDPSMIVKQTLAFECCSQPQIQMQSIRPCFVPFNNTFTLDLSTIFFSHDTISDTFRYMSRFRPSDGVD